MEIRGEGSLIEFVALLLSRFVVSGPFEGDTADAVVAAVAVLV